MELKDLFGDQIGNFFSQEAGQQRRAWLDRTDRRMRDSLSYYLGPHLYPQVERAANLAAITSPGQDVVDAHRAGEDLMDWRGPLDAAGDTAALAAAFGSMLMPGGVSSYRQGFDELVDAGVRAHKSGNLHIFAGPKAANADHAALRQAEAMETAGADRHAILRETGWFRGSDGNWRFEINDRPAELHLTQADDGKSLADALRHPEVHDAYRQLQNYPIDMVDFGDVGKRGGFLRADGADNGSIWLSPDTPDPLSVSLHETQHAIQEIEGFSGGGTPGKLRPGTLAWDLFSQRLRELTPPSVFARIAPALQSGDGRMISEAIQANNLDDYAFEAQRFAETEAYRRLPGEVEARNVQARHGMTPEQRREFAPWVTQDTPEKLQTR